MKTITIFSRNEGSGLTTFSIVEFNCKETNNPKLLMEKFQNSITKWVENSSEGAEAFEDSCQDFNIGDFSLFENDEKLCQYLLEEGLSVKILLCNDPDNLFSYDTHLVNL